MFEIDIANQQTTIAVDTEQVRKAVEIVLTGAAIPKARISVAVVDDPTIHDINRQFLDHDYATDVLSFVLEQSDKWLEGEVVVSADTAQSDAAAFGWSGHDELLLYVVHGTLHLVGFDDATGPERDAMRARQSEVLGTFGLCPKYADRDDDAGHSADPNPQSETHL